jgi:gamma-glutamylcyclotransferase (GGCT)/AIG2-like uncharacterized protein YtfP
MPLLTCNPILLPPLLLLFVPTTTITMALSRPHNLFVCGTLKRGFFNYETYLKRGVESGTAHYVGTAETCDKFALPILGERCIPALMKGTKEEMEHRIKGEVFEVSDSVLAAMDIILEGVASGFYYRAQKKVKLLREKDKQLLDCWIYLQNPPEIPYGLPTYPAYTSELHQSYVPRRAEPDPTILALLEQKVDRKTTSNSCDAIPR